MLSERTRGLRVQMSIAGYRIFDDNPASLDLLGFDAVVQPVVHAIGDTSLQSLTIGIRGGWGTGKSTLLGLLADSLKRDDGFLVLRVDPWEFESSGELRTTLIEAVLSELHARVIEHASLAQKVRRLLGRVRFGKVATALLRGAATVSLDGGWTLIGQIVAGLTADAESFLAPADEAQIPATMHGFRAEFRTLVDEVSKQTEFKKVVVLVDDLDRCMPNAVVESLEAIKLFLSVERMVFVLSADEEMVRSAIAASLAGTGRATVFAEQYLEKIVQLPMTIPSLGSDDADTYATLLLAAQAEEGTAVALVDHCRQRRQGNHIPLLAGAPHTDTTREAEMLARQICAGLRADGRMNPRRIKRFLNAFVVRQSIASARGVSLSPSSVAKLLLLEEQYADPEFRILASTPAPDIRNLLGTWEKWARGEGKRPEGITDRTREWARSGPRLADSQENLESYITLAASLTAVAAGGPLSSKVADFVETMFGPGSEGDAARSVLLNQMMGGLDDAEAEQAMLTIAARASALPTPADAVRLILDIAENRARLSPVACQIVRERLAPFVDLSVSAKIGTSLLPDVKNLGSLLSDDHRVPSDGRVALKRVLSRSGRH